MSDDLPDRELSHLEPALVERWLALLEFSKARGCPIFLTEGRRSFARQNWLYASGRTRPGKIVTNAKAGQSNHNPGPNGLGRALDFAFRLGDPFAESHPWELVAIEAERLGLEWGGRWSRPDKPHLQLPKGATT